MLRMDVVGYTCWRVLAWSGLIAAVFLLASLLQAVATGSTAGAVEAVSTPSQLSSATAAELDGDEVRAGDPSVLADIGFLAHLPEANCEMTATQPLYAGQSTWVTQTGWQCADPLP